MLGRSGAACAATGREVRGASGAGCEGAECEGSGGGRRRPMRAGRTECGGGARWERPDRVRGRSSA